MNTYLLIGIVAIVLLLILRFFVCNFFYKCKLLNEILKEKGTDGNVSYSQGRVYLLLSIISYYIILGLMTSKALKPNMNIDTKTLEMIIDALQWAIALFAGYVFGSKGLDVVKTVMGFKKNNTQGGNPIQ